MSDEINSILSDNDKDRLATWRGWLAERIVEEANHHVIAWLIGLLDNHAYALNISCADNDVLQVELASRADAIVRQEKRIADAEQILRCRLICDTNTPRQRHELLDAVLAVLVERERA